MYQYITVKKTGERCEGKSVKLSQTINYIAFYYRFLYDMLYLYTLYSRFSTAVSKVAHGSGKGC